MGKGCYTSSMGLFTWRGPERPAASGEPVARPTFFQQMTGSGEYMRALGSAQKQVKKGFFTNLKHFAEGKRLRRRDFAKDLLKQKERYFQRAGMSELATRPATKEELANPHLKYYVKEFEQRERLMRENFDRSERRAKEDIKKGYHRELRDTSAQVRAQGSAGLGVPTQPPTFFQHILGRDPTSKRRDSGRNSLSI